MHFPPTPNLAAEDYQSYLLTSICTLIISILQSIFSTGLLELFISEISILAKVSDTSVCYQAINVHIGPVKGFNLNQRNQYPCCVQLKGC